ncbi:MAG: hypothetical protein V1837_02670 [Candidatus Woesearchaeota archaeon]
MSSSHSFSRLEITAISLLVSLIFYAILISFILPFDASRAFAAPGYVNDTATTLLNITNFAPRVINVLVDDINSSPVHEIDLVSGTTRKVWCNGTVVDWNGKDDIIAVNATLYFIANKSSTPNDKNEHYSNRSCNAYRSGTYNKTYSCTFAVWFFANNGTWYCNMSAWDNGTANFDGRGAYNSSTNRTKVNPLYGLSVPPIINYGELALNKTSLTDKIENVTNTGNMNIDLQLYGYGGSVRIENNQSLKCRMGTIPIRNEHFSLTVDTAFESMTNLSGQFANPNDINNFNLAQRKSETINSTRNTYWKIRVPPVGVKGQCNGTIVFSSVIDD